MPVLHHFSASQIEHPNTSCGVNTPDKVISNHDTGVCNESTVHSPCEFCGQNDEYCDCDIITDFCILHQQSFITNAPVLEMDPKVCYCGTDGGPSTGKSDTASPDFRAYSSPDNAMSDSGVHTNSSSDCTQPIGIMSKHCGTISNNEDVASCASVQRSHQLVEMCNTVDNGILSTGTNNIFEEDDAKDRSTHYNTSISRKHPRNDPFSNGLHHGPPGFDVSPREQTVNITHCLNYLVSLPCFQVCGEHDLNALPIPPAAIYHTVLKDMLDCHSGEDYGDTKTHSYIVNAEPSECISSLFIPEEKREGENIEPRASNCLPDDSGNLFLSEDKKEKNVPEPSASICVPADSGDVTGYLSDITGHTNGHVEHCEEVMSSNIPTSKEVTAPTCDLLDTVKHQAVMDLCHSYGSEGMEWKEKEATDPCDSHAVNKNMFSVKDTRVVRVVRISLTQVNVGLFWSTFIMSSAVNPSLPLLVPVLSGLFYNHAPRPPEFHAHCFIPVADWSVEFEASYTGK